MSVGTTPAARTSWRWVSWVALLLGVVAAVLSAVALVRSPSSPTPLPAPSTAEATPTTLPAGQVADLRRRTCGVAVGAAEAIARERRPFLAAPPSWDDPATIAALTRVQASTLVELAAMQAAIRPSTPPELTDAIEEYRRSVLDMVDADTRRLPAAVSNAASARAATAASTITTLCKGE